MFSNVLLEKLVRPSRPGGGLNESYNQIAQDAFNRDILESKALYAPLTAAAQAASQFAYSRLVGPQFMAKLMSNPEFLSQIKDPSKRGIFKNLLVSTGMISPEEWPFDEQGNEVNKGFVQGSASPVPGVPAIPGQPGANNFNVPVQHTLFGDIAQGIKNIFSPGQRQQQPTNALVQPPPQRREQPQVVQPQQAPMPKNPYGGDIPKPILDENLARNGNRWNPFDPITQRQLAALHPASDQVIGATTAPTVAATAPEETTPIETKPPEEKMPSEKEEEYEPTIIPPEYAKTWTGNVAKHLGEIEEGKEAGKLRAQQIDSLSDVAFNAGDKLNVLKDLGKSVLNPIMRNIRQTPLAGQHEVNWYAREGTPEEQKLIGDLKAGIGQIVVSSAGEFKGQFRKGEQALINSMKVNEGDTVDVMIGKLENLIRMTKLIKARASLTSKYMDQFKITKTRAAEFADRQIDGNKIRRDVHDYLNGFKTIENVKTKERLRVLASRAEELLGAP